MFSTTMMAVLTSKPMPSASPLSEMRLIETASHSIPASPPSTATGTTTPITTGCR